MEARASTLWRMKRFIVPPVHGHSNDLCRQTVCKKGTGAVNMQIDCAVRGEREKRTRNDARAVGGVGHGGEVLGGGGGLGRHLLGWLVGLLVCLLVCVPSCVWLVGCLFARSVCLLDSEKCARGIG